MKNIFYKLAVRGLIAKKYSDLVLRDLFWDYEVNEDADKFLVEVEDRNSSDGLAVRIQISRQEFGKQHSFLETAAILLKNLDLVFEWYIKEEKHDN